MGIIENAADKTLAHGFGCCFSRPLTHSFAMENVRCCTQFQAAFALDACAKAPERAPVMRKLRGAQIQNSEREKKFCNFFGI